MNVPKCVYGVVGKSKRCYHIIHTFGDIDRATKSGKEGGMTQCGTNTMFNPVDLSITQAIPKGIPACQRCTKEAWRKPRVSKLSELLAKYEKLVSDTNDTRKELIKILGGLDGAHLGAYSPQASLSPFGTTSTSSNILVEPKWETIMVKPNYGKHNGRAKRVLRYINTNFQTRVFSVKDLMSKIGTVNKREKNLNSQALYYMFRHKILKRVGQGKYKLIKGGA